MAAMDAAARAEAWGITTSDRPGGRCKAQVIGAIALPVAVFAVIGFVLWGAGGLLPALIALIVGILILRTATRTLVEGLDPRPATQPRLVNIVQGLSKDLGLQAPRTFIVNGEGANALVFWHKGGPALGMTAAVADGFARTELEAVVAHCLIRLDPAAGDLDRMSLSLGGTFGSCRGGVTEADDVRAVAVTRYPPALAKSIERCEPATGRFSHLWFVADDATHASSHARVAALQDL